jgi:hypothetical protein
MSRLRFCTILCAVIASMASLFESRPTAQRSEPSATLIPSATISFSGSVDSNSPVVWETVAGVEWLFAFNSFDGWPSRAMGPQVQSLVPMGKVRFDNPPPHGIWIEAIVPDVDGTWYGYYHNERPADMCGSSALVLPRIGAARSTDLGVTWEDLGTILEAPPESYDCNTSNRYFVGGVGDLSVALDRDGRYLYIFFSQYATREQAQGVSVARMPWAWRDRPRGRVAVWWRGNAWIPARMSGMREEAIDYSYAAGMPIYRARDGWHDGNAVDAFWGPAVHWNTYLEQYVMLLNHATDAEFHQEGIYVSYAATLDDPTAWSEPERLLSGGNWYPQVVGIEPGTGTDRVAGEYARFFMAGRSRYVIRFAR